MFDLYPADVYKKISDVEPREIFVPYRICPLGAHVDHQLGLVTGMTLDRGIRILWSPRDDGCIVVCSEDFPGEACWHLTDLSVLCPAHDWADHLRGASVAFCEKHPLTRGISVAIRGEIPVGGLSSSAAVIIAFLLALSYANDVSLTADETVSLARQAENRFVGVSCGILDQSVIVFGEKDRLLYLDCRSGEHRAISLPGSSSYSIGVFYCGLSRSLSSSGYNARADECRKAAADLLELSGCVAADEIDCHLRDVPEETFYRLGSRLDEKLFRRARHFYSECDRVRRGVDAWSRGDLHFFGDLMRQSGESSISDYEVGGPELTCLSRILTSTPGVLGSRFSGAGFKGSCIALIAPGEEECVLRSVASRYGETMPHLADAYRAFICSSAPGVLQSGALML